MENEVLSVSELRDYINQTLTYAYPLIVVQGEVSGYKVNQGKWVFFDLKDAETTISCFMTTYQLKTVLEDGMLIRVAATPNLTKWGRFSLTVKSVELAGEGEVKRAFDLLKAQFEREGLFDPARKRVLPAFPQRIGLITSTEAAAYNDFVTIARDRWPLVEIMHTHVHVQGMQAPADVVRAIQSFNLNQADLDALVVIRGGGSAEDLQAFNHEDVVRAVYGSHIPTIVGIGHEDDVSLAELAADVRAATPTDAARRLLPDQHDVARQLRALAERQSRATRDHLQAVARQIAIFESHVRRVYRVAGGQLTTLSDRLDRAMQRRLTDWRHTLDLMRRTLDGANPSRILARGYAIARVRDQVVHAPDQIRPGDAVMLQLHKGTITLHSGGEDDQTDSQISLDL
ncbi:MAG: exodeoxyribonuclease VII large subunit [Candidatus Saccharibacteria bacterium]